MKNILVSLSLLLSFCLSAKVDQFNENQLQLDLDDIANASVLFEDDLLIGRRNDFFEDGVFMVNDSTEYYYDENGNLELIQHFAWDGIEWVNSFRTNYAHDTNGNRTLFQRQVWDSIEWMNDYQYIYEFTSTNNRSLFKRQSWVDGAWQNDDQAIYYYNDEDLLAGFLAQEYINGSWVDDTEDFISYDEQGLRLEKITDRWNGTAWEKRFITTYKHDNNGNRTENDRLLWADPEWETSRKDIFGWDNQGNQTSYTLQLADGNNGYDNLLYREYIFDENNVLTRDVYSRWINNEWILDNARDHFYDDRENNHYVLTTDWLDNDWIETFQTFFYYQFPSSTKDILNNSKIDLFPNPSNGIFDLQIIGDVDLFQLDVYDMQGIKIEQQVMNGTKSTIDLSHLENGVYFVSIYSDKQASLKKVIIAK